MGYPCWPRFSSVAGLPSTHVSGRFRRAQEPHDTCCLSPWCRCSDEIRYGNMDRVPKPNEMCSAAQPQFLLSILEGLVALPCVRCDRVFPVTLDMIDSAAYLVPPGQLHHCHHLTVALLLSIELGACCISRLCTCTGMPAWEACRSRSWWCRRIASQN